MNKKLLITGAVASIVLLAGCSNHDDMNESMSNLTNQVSELSAKVDMVADDQASMKADLATVAGEAERANSRIDNIATSYKK
ncbi:major outer membrane lipoprotein, putative [Psychromonas ingrahamii 37]|uniref:Major outer membrane lipoprotein Lpp n=1 Tax=Psychromonas ingrahamii (strain DSM 17664 / CCUG 51855 / 37) TaxID=357804 RepID=A1SXX7_PSYIN|nr:Lpp/OprI family alanine-zipper lipoprotein [Psychromonas ingrahamii]ABM04342.1 major outer membrane lipoprotein, putative [Psychromonas ingrahamii 37]